MLSRNRYRAIKNQEKLFGTEKILIENILVAAQGAEKFLPQTTMTVLYLTTVIIHKTNH